MVMHLRILLVLVIAVAVLSDTADARRNRRIGKREGPPHGLKSSREVRELGDAAEVGGGKTRGVLEDASEKGRGVRDLGDGEGAIPPWEGIRDVGDAAEVGGSRGFARRGGRDTGSTSESSESSSGSSSGSSSDENSYGGVRDSRSASNSDSNSNSQ
ncbi:uncharacterized protein LOC144859777 [Branchiostoma floridae x Branchiostoma japonicum]